MIIIFKRKKKIKYYFSELGSWKRGNIKYFNLFINNYPLNYPPKPEISETYTIIVRCYTTFPSHHYGTFLITTSAPVYIKDDISLRYTTEYQIHEVCYESSDEGWSLRADKWSYSNTWGKCDIYYSNYDIYNIDGSLYKQSDYIDEGWKRTNLKYY